MRSEYTPSELKILWRIIQHTVFIRVPLATAPGECWVSTYSQRPDGYALMQIGKRKHCRVHRVAYEIINGPIPEPLVPDHLCRIPACWRPSHIEPVTVRENCLRSPTSPFAINARKTHCPKGHALAGENLYLRPGRRRCRTCL